MGMAVWCPFWTFCAVWSTFVSDVQHRLHQLSKGWGDDGHFSGSDSRA